MTELEWHELRHKELHKALDELIADFIAHNPEFTLSNTTLLEFMIWSGSQQKTPTEQI